jgi:hypothetical protein
MSIDTQALAEARKRISALEIALRECMNSFNMTRLIMPLDAGREAAELLAEWRQVLNSDRKQDV